MFAIVDYDTGNTLNLKKALNYSNIENKLTADPEEILNADAVILPGVGAFEAAVEALKERHLIDVLKKAATDGKPFLGICLGMQLLFQDSEEYGVHPGLNLIPGHIKAIPENLGLKIPQMGWNENVAELKADPLAMVDQKYTYFVHSYYAQTDPEYIVADVDYGIKIPSIVAKDNVVGMQFHPEKSGSVGLSY